MDLQGATAGGKREGAGAVGSKGIEHDEFCISNDEFRIKMMNFVSK